MNNLINKIKSSKIKRLKITLNRKMLITFIIIVYIFLTINYTYIIMNEN